jgi:hypothetical protein
VRVLLTPELYRPGEPSANGTLGDVATWVDRWLAIDGSQHAYWLVPPDCPDEAVLADRERVTAIRAERFGEADPDVFTEGGYSWNELAALKREIFDRGAYLDAVVDQRRSGRFDLSKWLSEHTDRWAADVAPFDLVANVHDLQVPEKYRYCSHRDGFQARLAMAGAVFADSIWFKAGVDARRLRKRATTFLRPEVVEDALAAAVETGSPIDRSAFEESYRERPRYLHLAGSMWAKKRADRLLDIAARLNDAFGVETILTSVDAIPEAYAEPEWVEAHPEADRGTYETALRRGDLAVCASEYETMARTPFEQALSGQVLVVRDEPWVDDCVPGDYPLRGDLDDLPALAAAAVEHWEAAVRANRRLAAHVSRVRDPKQSGARTHHDLHRRVARKTARYELGPEDAPVSAALDGVTRIALDDLRARTARHTDDGRPVTAREDYALADLLYALRSAGYRDAGNPGTPVFESGRRAAGSDRPD